MAHSSINAHQQQLNYLFAKSSILNSDPEILSHWARYLCVLSCGFIEVSIKTIIEDYAKKHSSPQLVNYTTAQLIYFYSPNTNKILDLIQKFDLTWKQSLINSLTDEIKDALDSIANNKNSIAHGQSTGITFLTIKNYFDQACKAISILEKTIV